MDSRETEDMFGLFEQNYDFAYSACSYQLPAKENFGMTHSLLPYCILSTLWLMARRTACSNIDTQTVRKLLWVWGEGGGGQWVGRTATGVPRGGGDLIPNA